MEFTAQQIADYLRGSVEGDRDVRLSELSKIEEGRPGTLTFLSNPKYTHYIYSTKASAVLVDEDFVPEHPVEATLIRVPSAYQALAQLLTLVDSLKPKKHGVHEKAVVASSSKIGENVYIAPYAVVGENVIIGDNSKIYPHVHLDDGVRVGADCILYAGVAVYENCVIGNRCIIHAGAVIGADGFGFAPDAEGHYHKIPQIGNVLLEDDVEIGANTTVDRATMGSTVVRRGVKIDNLNQVAHNVEIGEDTVMAAQSGIAGSSKLGRRCVVAGQVGFAGHIHVADGSTFGAQTGVPSSIRDEGQIWQGYPAMPVGTFRRMAVVQKQLPDLLKTVQQLERRIRELEKEQ